MAKLTIDTPTPPPSTYVLEMTEAEARVLRSILGNLAGTVDEVSSLWDAVRDVQHAEVVFSVVNGDQTRHRIDYRKVGR